MRIKLVPIDVVLPAAAACYAVALADGPFWLSRAAGAVLCFGLTGLTIARAAIPRSSGALPFAVAMVAGSIVVGVIGGLILDVVPSGLNRSNWLSYSLIIIITAYSIVCLRGGRRAKTRWNRTRFTFRAVTGGTKIFVSALVVVSAVIVALGVANPPGKPFTEVWLVPEGPDRSPAGARSAILGIKSHEVSTEEFTIVLDTGSRVLTDRVTVGPQQAWTQSVPLEGPKATASVYRGAATGEPYRMVWIATQ